MLLFAALLQLGCDNTDSKPDKSPAGTELNTPRDNVESQHHQGKWVATAATLEGNPFPSAVTESISLTITGDQYEVMVGDKPDKGTCSIDADHTPNRMKINGTEGPNTGKTFLAIFDFPNADEMRVCYDLSGSEYPTEFESTAENGLYLVDYSRPQ